MSLSPPTQHPPVDWEPAPADAVARLVRQLRRRRSRRQFLRAATSAASVLAVGGASWLLWPRCGNDFDYGGINCTEVVRLGHDYMAGNVSEPTRGRIAAHVARCPHCGPLYKKMEANVEVSEG